MILCSDLRKCPRLNGLQTVNAETIKQYEGNTEVEALICSRDVAQVAQYMNIPNLKVIQLFSAGFDNIDPKLLQSKGIHLCNAANVYNVGMAEFVVYAMLMRAKRYNHSIKSRNLRPFRNYHYITELSGKTVGILGAGNIGQQIAKRLEAFEMYVWGYDLKTDDRPHFEKVYNQEKLQEFLAGCDYIVNCMPLFKSTEGMLNKGWFDLMKSDVTIVNVGRKKLINDADFIAFLKSHKDATAILDMFEKVPNPITNPYRRLCNVLVLPGVTAISQEINQKLVALIGENVKRLESGETFLNQIV
ncbi:NAD(P)-dependent oxidoreductase [Bacteroides sp.]